jgi:hypothetical protein
MVMYYMGYSPDKNSSGLLHNIGLMLFSLQAIVSFGMATTKSDVRKSFHCIYDHNSFALKKILDLCRRKSENDDKDDIKGNERAANVDDTDANKDHSENAAVDAVTISAVMKEVGDIKASTIPSDQPSARNITEISSTHHSETTSQIEEV